jgi:hypothetical protein
MHGNFRENAMNEHTSRTQDRKSRQGGFRGCGSAAQRDKGLRFTTLLHHVNEKLLLDRFYLLKRQAAPGMDQQAVVEVLNQIYEEDFAGFSYGFRPGCRAHDALDR